MTSEGILHPDRKSYEKIWDEVIGKEINHYLEAYKGYITLLPNAKEEVWAKYKYLNEYCKMNYMKTAEGKLDRHKVAACYLIAISSVKPMRFVGEFLVSDEETYFVANELLSITVALSVVTSFILTVAEKNPTLSNDEREQIRSQFKTGIRTPDEFINHGVYLDNFASEIRHAVDEGAINILSIAHELYLLEVITRLIGNKSLENEQEL